MAEKKSVSESDTIILTLHERWWKKMLAGEKILEIRKTAPVQKDREYRVLVYVTGGGGVCGEFTCTDFMKIKMLPALLETHKKQSCLTENQIREYAGESKKNLWGWAVTDVKEYYNTHPLGLYGLKKPPQSWCYYKGREVPDIMTINNLANICGYFFNAELDPETKCGGVNNGYNCRHPKQEENCGGIGCCYQWSCPLANVIPADEEDCEKYGLDYEESEFVLVYQKVNQENARQNGGNKLVYICSPYRGEVERNVQYARELTRIALDNGFAPITPHLYLTQAVNEEVVEERKKGMAAGKELLKHCKYILIGGRYGLSEGMLEEIELAFQCGTIELALTKAGLIEVFNGGQQS